MKWLCPDKLLLVAILILMLGWGSKAERQEPRNRDGQRPEMAVTKAYTEYLKQHVGWEVLDYEDNPFRGWTLDEFKESISALIHVPFTSKRTVQTGSRTSVSPVSWMSSSCDHGVRNRGECNSNWAITTADMLGMRGCLQGHDHGWLSPQELISCDTKNHGCAGGWNAWSLDYVKSVKGLVSEACFPYQQTNVACPTKCDNKEDWKTARHCDCVGEYKSCHTVQEIMEGLQSGPVTLTFGIKASFIYYKSGTYRCEKDLYTMGPVSTLALGFENTTECRFMAKNAWGTAWGRQGYFNISCDTCDIGNMPNGIVYCPQVAP